MNITAYEFQGNGLDFTTLPQFNVMYSASIILQCMYTGHAFGLHFHHIQSKKRD